MPARKISIDTPNLTVSIDIEDDDQSPRESYAVPGIVSGDSPDADAFVNAVEEMIDEHGLWGWCQVTVAVRLGPLKGESHMGGCSYKDEEDFKKNSGYYNDMVADAIADLQNSVGAMYALIHVD